MPTGTFERFKAQALADGFDEVQVCHWPADAVLDAHTHPFAVKARVVQGEMWLTIGATNRHLTPGDTFELDRDVVHDERYGHTGATYWVARRN